MSNNTKKQYCVTILVDLGKWELALTVEMEQREAKTYFNFNYCLAHDFSVMGFGSLQLRCIHHTCILLVEDIGSCNDGGDTISQR